jgi:hypothetical protein
MPVSRTIKQQSGAALVAAAAIGAALPFGLYYPKGYAVGAIAIWVAVMAGYLARALPLRRVGSPAVLAGGCLAAAALLSAVSIAWATDQGQAFEQAVRASAFLGLFTLAACTASLRGREQWIAGLTVGLVAVALLSVLSWLQPGLLGERLEEVPGRLSYPLGYWNAVGALLALAAVLLAYAGARAPERRLRIAATAAMPVPVLGIWLTTSGGAIAAVVVGLGILVATGVKRGRQAITCAVGLAGGAAAIVASLPMDALDAGLTNAEARSEGDWLSLILIGVVVATGAVALVVERGVGRPLRLPRPLATGLAILALAGVVVGVVLADPPERFQQFKEPPSSSSELVQAGGGADVSGNGRWQLWEEAVDAFGSAPLAGIGAGGYEDYWAQHAPIAFFARNPHSLPLQEFAELGLPGGMLVLGFAAAVGIAAVQRLRHDRAGDAGVLLAVVASASVTAAIDWSWQFPAVIGPPLVAAGLLTAAAPGRRASVRDSYALGVASLAVAWICVIGAGLVLLTELKLSQSRRAEQRGEIEEAIARAKEARTVQPWSSRPYATLAALERDRGDLSAALDYVAEAEKRDSEDWHLVSVEAVLLFERGDRSAGQEAFERARALNPRARYLGGSG